MTISETGQHKYYRPELDALRFFAFFCVFGHHALQNGNAALVLGQGRLAALLALMGEVGNFGMSLFFVLSAYLITQLLLLEIGRTGTVQIRAFYSRRVLRIWPLYFFFIALCVLLAHLVQGWMYISGGRIAAFLLLSANWYLIFHAFSPFELGILWSISIEEQFYLVWPAVVLLGRRRRGIEIASAIFASLGLGTLIWLGHRGANGLHTWLNSFVQFMFFAGGARLALLTTQRQPRWKPTGRVAAIAAGLALWFVAAGATHFMQDPSPVLRAPALVKGYSASLAGTLLIFLGVLGAPAEAVPGWLRYLGKISYGLYVYHMLMFTAAIWATARVAHWLHLHGTALVGMKVATPFVALALTVCVAAASYRWLESPFLRLRKRFTIVANRPI